MISCRGWVVALQLASVAVLVPGLSWADESVTERLAHEKFRDGRALVEQQRWSEAAERFTQSQRLDPAPGTLANLAFCYEKLGNASGAWIAYKETARAARGVGKFEWATMAEQSAAAIERTSPRVVIQVAPRDSGDVSVSLDGLELPAPLWGDAPPVTPGRHELRARASGKRPWSTPFDVSVGRETTVVVPPLEPEAPVSPAGVMTSREAPAPPQAVAPGSPLGPRRTAAAVLGGTAIASVLAGVALAGLGMATYAQASSSCVADTCDARGARLRTTAITESNVASVAFAIGGTAAAGGLVLWLTAPARAASGRQRTAVELGLGGAW